MKLSRFKVKSLFRLIFLCSWFQSPAQPVQIPDSLLKKSLEDFHAFLSLPNDAHYPQDLEVNMAWLEKAFAKRNFLVKRLPTLGIDLLFAEKINNKNHPTILFYLQVDGQPVDPTRWQQATPWTPTLKSLEDGEWNTIPWAQLYDKPNPDWRIFARSASDAKGPIAAFLTALDLMQSKGKQANYNIKVIMDSEEELGSPHITEAVQIHREILKADAMVILDGPMHISNKPTLAYGARGIISFSLTAYGPLVNVHSGHYGNYVPNPVFTLARLLAGMKDERGKVLIPGFYEGINLDPVTREILSGTPDDLPALHRDLGFKTPDQVGANLQEAIQYPSLNIDGIRAGYVGAQARTIIPDLATAAMDIRLVKETSGETMIRLLKNHILAQGFTLLDHEPNLEERRTHDKIISLRYQISYEAFRTELNDPLGIFLTKALIRAHGSKPVQIRTHGGSIPISPFVVKLGFPAIAVPVVNYDNNQHSENENIRFGNYLDGIQSYYSILTTGYDPVAGK